MFFVGNQASTHKDYVEIFISNSKIVFTMFGFYIQTTGKTFPECAGRPMKSFAPMEGVSLWGVENETGENM